MHWNDPRRLDANSERYLCEAGAVGRKSFMIYDRILAAQCRTPAATA